MDRVPLRHGEGTAPNTRIIVRQGIHDNNARVKAVRSGRVEAWKLNARLGYEDGFERDAVTEEAMVTTLGRVFVAGQDEELGLDRGTRNGPNRRRSAGNLRYG